MKQNGSALIALAAIMTVLGVMMAFGIDAFKLKSSQDRYKETEIKLKAISAAISSRVQSGGRIPCPADPSLNYTSTNYSSIAATGTSCTFTRGRVPARALQIPEEYMLDAWGNHIRYAVSPAFSHTNQASMTTVHAYCRIQDVWIYDEKMCPLTPAEAGYPRPYNVNADKARFCCPDNTLYPTANDLRVRLKDGSFIGRTRSSVAAEYAADNVAVTSAAAPVRATPHQIETTAYVLVSFGANGSGGALAGSDEAENADADDEYIDNVRNLNDGAQYFDDIVLAKTQFQAMADLNSGSCTRPYFNFSPDVTCP
jgi:hypothetical protein